MGEKDPHRTRELTTQLRRVAPLLAVVLALLALWCAWQGVRQWQAGQRSASVAQARDAAVNATGQALQAELRRMGERLASAPVQRALQDGRLDTAGVELGRDWPGATGVAVVPRDLRNEYNALAQGRFGRLAALESALAAGEPVLMVAGGPAGPQVLVTAPARVGERPVGVAIATLPLERATAGLAAVDVDPATYVALRQGSHTLMARGEPALSNVAERLGQPVPGTQLRIVAATPHVGRPPFGLSALPLWVLAAALLALAVVSGWLARRRSRVGSEPDAEPTLAQSLHTVEVHRPAPRPAPTTAPKPAAARLDPSIFRAYDIRGVVGRTLDVAIAERIGRAIGTLMHEQGLDEIVVGRDGRLSGPDLTAGLVAGLRASGRNVVDIGLVPTPLSYFAAYHLRTGCCVSVTGSHNPPEYNGFKIVVGGETLSGDAITDLHARIASERLYAAPVPGGLVERDLADDYIRRIVDDIQIARPLKVVVDAGNGAAGILGPRVLEAIGADVIPLHCEIDGTFPNHHPDPSEPRNLADLIDVVKRMGADLGVAFDGDGDRLGVVAADGAIIDADRLLMLFAADLLERNPGALIVHDVKCTGRLTGHVLRHGGSPLMWKTGHSLIKAKMRETGAELAGEMSGHFFFAERWFGFDDGLYAAARLLEILALQADPTAALHALPVGVSTPELKVDVPGGDPQAFVARFMAQAAFDGARLSTIDGLRADWPDGWGLVRASNTTPVLVLRFDADDAQALARIQASFRERLLAIEPGLTLPF
ncbi:phosphomannomutase/phosphoglucomutase [Luteimonas sp. S4-F44]|uniref:phosphomannomutase/phosphoglucomutase n=1 Tax=Luteimonas sp. S4-F44 TaxID=2925842 RepID=UPI001F533FF5|nr:phosphomannomutase/phosphoglucomutase [Luteimonas sp. S4-F44]UNK42603.1 phosphomannomutase/phosphoglucomutase [Luteimonas sp. S4-F44]